MTVHRTTSAEYCTGHNIRGLCDDEVLFRDIPDPVRPDDDSYTWRLVGFSAIPRDRFTGEFVWAWEGEP